MLIGKNTFSDIYDTQVELNDIERSYFADGGSFFVAHAGSELQGFVGLHNDDGNGTLKRLAVLPQFEGRQIGPTLVAALVDWARQHELIKISLQTGAHEDARKRVYLPAGFIDTGRVPKKIKKMNT